MRWFALDSEADGGQLEHEADECARPAEDERPIPPRR